MLATTSIGAIWASCSPDFGGRGVHRQVRAAHPRCCSAWTATGTAARSSTARAEMAQIIAGLPALEQVDPRAAGPAGRSRLARRAALGRAHGSPAGARAELRVRAGAVRPSAVDPVLLRHHRAAQGDHAQPRRHPARAAEAADASTWTCAPATALFFFTTTGWMMWNFLVSSLLLGVCRCSTTATPPTPIPACCGRWREDAQVTLFGASPAYVRHAVEGGHRARRESYDLSALRRRHAGRLAGVGRVRRLVLPQRQARPVAAPAAAAPTSAPGSSAACPRCRCTRARSRRRTWACAAYAFNERGEAVVGEVGEIVITQPMPSMPVGFWGDTDGEPVPRLLFRRFPRRVAPGRLLQGQRPRRLLRARPLGRHPEPARRAHRHRGDLRACSTPSPRWRTRSSSTSTCPAAGSSCRCSSRWPTGAVLDDAIRGRSATGCARSTRRATCPDKIIQVPAIPATLTGKKMEVPVRKLLLGVSIRSLRSERTDAEYARRARCERILRALVALSAPRVHLEVGIFCRSVIGTNARRSPSASRSSAPRSGRCQRL